MWLGVYESAKGVKNTSALEGQKPGFLIDSARLAHEESKGLVGVNPYGTQLLHMIDILLSRPRLYTVRTQRVVQNARRSP